MSTKPTISKQKEQPPLTSKKLHIKNTRYNDENQSPGFEQAEKYSEEYQSNVHNISI